MTDLIRSWVTAANEPDAEFPVNNLPFGVFSVGDAPRCGTAIGDRILDLAALQEGGMLPDCGFDQPAINGFMERGPGVWAEVRELLTGWLRDTPTPDRRVADCLQPIAEATLHLPFRVAEYTDFYAGRRHAFNVGSMFRGPENALPPNWLHIPIGYNGRASTVVVSGTGIHRPNGQLMPQDAELPTFGPCRRLDIELEFGAVIGTSTEMGRPVTVDEADELIFGYVLLNDWSARDIQTWEYQPLGPFQAKAFATTISPWVVTRAALEPFRIAAPPREVPLLPYLRDTRPMLYDIDLAITFTTATGEPTPISRTNSRELYYSAAQQLAHHASSGCRMRTGDLLGSGTISGPDRSAYGSLLELSWGGDEPIPVGPAETRTFLEDGDTVTLHGHAAGDGYRIGFGSCAGTILPARS
ncbi:MAG: fumarylacetoacetase [Actinomycetota bacterium]